jgi:hypothetical protein
MMPTDRIVSGGIQINTTPQKARELLERLATSDDYRKTFSDDVVGELEKYGFRIDGSLVPDRVVLPPKHELEEVLYHVAQWDDTGRSPSLDPPLGYLVFVVTFGFQGH